MTLEAGDWRIATLTVDPNDGTTVAVLTVISPAGALTTPDVTSADSGATWTAEGYEFTVPGEWVERWMVTGTGKSKERAVLLVAPDPVTVPTGARVYATTTDYANALLAAPPAGARRALLAASKVVDEMLLTAVYDVDDDGLPTTAAHIIALRDATCAQAEYAKRTGDANSVGAGAISAFSIGPVQVTKGTPSGATRSPLPAHWSPGAYRELSQAGLTGHEPWGY